MLASGSLSLIGACVIIFSALRFRELSKRFFAIRLIFFLALTDCVASIFNVLGAIVDLGSLLRPVGKPPYLCVLQAVGLLYFNLASIMWTSCFAFVRAATCFAWHGEFRRGTPHACPGPRLLSPPAEDVSFFHSAV